MEATDGERRVEEGQGKNAKVAKVAQRSRILSAGDGSGYTAKMDSVRFGRALGLGARNAVKTMMMAADAATAENPSAKKAQTQRGSGTAKAESQAAGRASAPVGSQAAAQAVRTMTQKAAGTAAQAREVKQGVARGGRRFGEAVWSPFVRLSGVLWLEVTGVFFGIFALFAMGTVWKLRGAWHSTAADHSRLLGAAAMAIVFTYFCISGFAKAHCRERRR